MQEKKERKSTWVNPVSVKKKMQICVDTEQQKTMNRAGSGKIHSNHNLHQQEEYNEGLRSFMFTLYTSLQLDYFVIQLLKIQTKRVKKNRKLQKNL